MKKQSLGFGIVKADKAWKAFNSFPHRSIRLGSFQAGGLKISEQPEEDDSS